MKIEDILKSIKEPSPIGFDPEQDILWKFPFWRDDFRKRLTKKKWSILLSICKINLIAFLLSVIITVLIHFYTNIIFTESSMMSLSIGIMTTSAAIIAIIIAFLTYLYGNSISNMQRVKTRIGDELIILEDIKEKIDPYTNRPKESVQEPLKSKVIELSKKTKKFLDALKAISGRFHRAGSGTYYDNVELFSLRSVVNLTGGDWFVNIAKTFPGHEMHDFGKNTYIKAIDVVQRLSNLNTEENNANKQLNQVVLFLPFLASVLLTFVIGLSVSFIAGSVVGIESESILPDIANLFLGITLITLLPVQLIGIIKNLWSLFLSKYVGDETRRLYDTKTSKDIENKYNFDYSAALLKEAETLISINNPDNPK